MIERVLHVVMQVTPAFGAGLLLGYGFVSTESIREGREAGAIEASASWRSDAVANGHGMLVENPNTGEQVFFWKGTEPSASDIESGGWPTPDGPRN